MHQHYLFSGANFLRHLHYGGEYAIMVVASNFLVFLTQLLNNIYLSRTFFIFFSLSYYVYIVVWYLTLVKELIMLSVHFFLAMVFSCGILVIGNDTMHKGERMKVNLNRLNCMNYHVSESTTGDHWYAQNGLRSLYQYAKIATDFNFRAICELLNDLGEVTIKDKRTGNYLTLTMI